MAARHISFAPLSKLQEEVENLPPILRGYEHPRIDVGALDPWILDKIRERARACFDPDGRKALSDERTVLYYVMLGDVPPRCREVFRLYFIEKLKLRTIAARLRIEVRTAKRDLVRALRAVAREQREVEREGVVAKDA